MNPDAYLPMPDTAHPAYENQAQTIRNHLDRHGNRNHLDIYEASHLKASFHSPDVSPADVAAMPRRHTLTIKKCAGPAPFVGDARMEQGWYTWFVAVDDAGRHIAGTANLDISPSPDWRP